MPIKTMQILFRRRLINLFKLRVRACVCVCACVCARWMLVNALHFRVWSKSLANDERRSQKKLYVNMQIGEWIYRANTLANLFINSSHYFKLNANSEIKCRKFSREPALNSRRDV